MLKHRVIPCLLLKDSGLVKTKQFAKPKYVGDPINAIRIFNEKEVDELVFLDISATEQKRKTLATLVRHIAAEVDIPFTVGGGISSVEDVDVLLKNGADKVSINSSAVRRPELISELVSKFGSQCIVVAIDAKEGKDGWKVHLVGGKVATDIDFFAWAEEVADRGAGEILFTSMDHDGTKAGFANETLARLSERINIPIIASGGAGTMSHFKDAFHKGKADAALAASVFHFKEMLIRDLKKYLKDEGIAIRI